MPHSTAVILVVGLNESLLAAPHAPRLSAFTGRGMVRQLIPPLPAVTCTVQSSMLTGLMARDHGIVANGWYNRELAEIHFWKQSNHLVQGEKVWETARRDDPSITCANLFWWFNMHSSANWSVTPRPIYKADGRKIPDIYTQPAALRDELQDSLGRFPLFNFWGPGSSIVSSRWIADATKIVVEQFAPTLTLVYLPHLDYALQRVGPDHASIGAEMAAIDSIAGDLIDFFEARGVRVMIVSEYGIEPVDETVPVNRALRAAGFLHVRAEGGLELLDPGGSEAFAVADHQIAHVYVKDAAKIPGVAGLCQKISGVERVLDRAAQAALQIDHPRAGELVLISAARRWFTYDYWLDDTHAPDFARTVDIHRKPGYDPRELFIDPRFRWPQLAVASRLLRRKLGFRTLLDVVPLDTSLVRGSHGRIDQPPHLRPLLITQHGPGSPGAGVSAIGRSASSAPIPATAVRDVILDHLFAPDERARQDHDRSRRAGCGGAK